MLIWRFCIGAMFITAAIPCFLKETTVWTIVGVILGGIGLGCWGLIEIAGAMAEAVTD